MNRLLKTPACFAVAAIFAAGQYASPAVAPFDSSSGSDGRSQTSRVTPVAGESWLTHLNRSFGDTSMGKTGYLGPAPSQSADYAASQPPRLSATFGNRTVVLRGADLYRLNCQGCHGESGEGAPPEINSVINPVRATSVALVLERMKSVGMDIAPADAAKLAQQSKAALLQRLHSGGQDMPSFPQLSEVEIRLLTGYLGKLAGVPGAGREQAAVQEPAVRVGELIVKSTCHTCHSATGADPSPQQLLNGAIPPLSTLTLRKSEPEFVQKVTQGSPVLMGTPPLLCRGRMPVFHYLSEEEAADVYLYLTQYPPSERASSAAAIAMTQQDVKPLGGPPGNGVLAAGYRPTEDEAAEDGPSTFAIVLLAIVGSLIALALVGGLGFTLHEFRKLSTQPHSRNFPAGTAHTSSAGMYRSLAAMPPIPYSAAFGGGKRGQH